MAEHTHTLTMHVLFENTKKECVRRPDWPSLLWVVYFLFSYISVLEQGMLSAHFPMESELSSRARCVPSWSHQSSFW